ncbi:polysaccharide biosynthesis/export family protein [Pseudoxanthomonas wuyuanensis]
MPIRRILSLCLTFLLALSLLAGCSSGAPPARELPPADPLGEALGRPEYRIGPGDLMLVKVFQVEDLEREVRVDNEGRISLPLIGVVQAAGLSLNELQETVAARYGERYLQDPQVSILIQEFTSQKVTVSGAVDQPGIYPMAGSHLTLQQALALGHGVSNVASRRNVVVFRSVQGQRMVARFDLVEIERGKMPDPDIYGGDIVVVYRSDARLLLRTMLELTPLVMVWRAYR